MKAPRAASAGAGLQDLAAAVARIEARQAAYEQVVHRVLDTLEVHNEKLDAILEAATLEPGPGPVTETLTAILLSLREQERLLLDLPQALTDALRGEHPHEADADADAGADEDAEEDADEEHPAIAPAGSWRFTDRTREGS